MGLDARRRTPLLDRRDVGFARALRRRGAAGIGLLARRVPEDVRARAAQLSTACSMACAAAESSPWQATSSPSWIVADESGRRTAGIGETLPPRKATDRQLTVQFRDPEAKNTHGDNPRVSRVDVIVGEVHGASEDANVDRNPTTRVLARFYR